MTNYAPDDTPSYGYCIMEGCVSSPHCPRCGNTNYPHLGYLGAIGRWAKAWDCSKEEAESRIVERAKAAWLKDHPEDEGFLDD